MTIGCEDAIPRMQSPNKKYNESVCVVIETEAVDTGEPLIELIVAWCENNEVDPEDFAENYATPKLIEKLAEELRAAGLLKNSRKVDNILARLCCE